MLIVARHGQTAANAAGLLLGRADVELDDTGRRQAAALAEAVGPADVVVSSPLRRAVQTAGQPTVHRDRTGQRAAHVSLRQAFGPSVAQPQTAAHFACAHRLAANCDHS